MTQTEEVKDDAIVDEAVVAKEVIEVLETEEKMQTPEVEEVVLEALSEEQVTSINEKMGAIREEMLSFVSRTEKLEKEFTAFAELYKECEAISAKQKSLSTEMFVLKNTNIVSDELSKQVAELGSGFQPTVSALKKIVDMDNEIILKNALIGDFIFDKKAKKEAEAKVDAEESENGMHTMKVKVEAIEKEREAFDMSFNKEKAEAKTAKRQEVVAGLGAKLSLFNNIATLENLDEECANIQQGLRMIQNQIQTDLENAGYKGE